MKSSKEQQHIERVQDHLLSWYRQNRRKLPWRENISGYRTWVSEIMLQQTRVEAAIPYYERFLNELPDLKHLAAADDDLLHKLWEGLGYYNRVRNMKKCAQVCVEKYGGELPCDYDTLCTLPGIGPYTAGAVASIAFHQRVCAVDGNVLRVFSRILENREDISKEATKKHYKEYVGCYLPQEEDMSDFNQAIMELGALICLPNHPPLCTQCPLRQECKAYAHGTQNELPIKAGKKERRIEAYTVLVCVCDGKMALMQRPAKGLLANLYGFAMQEGKLTPKAVRKIYPKAAHIVKLRPHVHVFSHVEWHMEAFLVETSETDENYHTIEEITEQYAVPSAFQPFYQAACEWIRAKEQ